MLNCTVCGHDNFPFTNSQISGWASGQSLQMVEKCHQCGARIAESCYICSRLHPLNTTHCPVYGLNIKDFKNRLAYMESEFNVRVSIFRELPEAAQAMAEIARSSYIMRGVGYLGLAALISGFLFKSVILAVPFMVIGISLLVATLIIVSIRDSKMSWCMFNLWRAKNPEVLEPARIHVRPKSIDLDYDEQWNEGYDTHTISYHRRAFQFILNSKN